ncbi:MAG: type I 3-dehydroquinate dehydratase [Blastocatellia bacterium]|nr:type I 3-dehydroquinate dehydratase [Blastocatellia bacterium]
MLCTPILSRTLATVPQAMHQAAAQADWIEWRLDFLEDFDFGNPVPQVAPVLAHSPRPVILTFRPQEQGGARPLSLSERWAFWRHASQLEAARFDFEADLVNWALQENQPLPPWEKIIVSHHDFEQTPEDLPGLVGQMFPAPVQTFKLATKASNTSDLLRLFQLLESTSRQAIVIGMGMPGAATRILGPAYGSLVTFTTAADGAPSAPGQFSARALREVFHLPALNRETTVTGLIGCPVGHSLSPHIHNATFAALGINGVYVPFEVQPDGQDLPAFVRNFVHPRTRCCGWPLRGLSVTIPHKVNVVPLCDRLTETAQGVGAVNTLLVEDGQLIGHNTDVAGGMEPLEKKIWLTQRSAGGGAGGGRSGAGHSVRFGSTGCPGDSLCPQSGSRPVGGSPF